MSIKHELALVAFFSAVLLSGCASAPSADASRSECGKACAAAEPVQSQAASKPNVFEQLRELKALYDNGSLSREEYLAKRIAILKTI